MNKLDTRRRLSKFNDAARNTILGAIKAGATFEVAARAAGISRQSLVNWLRRGEYEDSCGSDSD
jgi:lambda repressor-like predicted transcriptional regulator